MNDEPLKFMTLEEMNELKNYYTIPKKKKEKKKKSLIAWAKCVR